MSTGSTRAQRHDADARLSSPRRVVERVAPGRPQHEIGIGHNWWCDVVRTEQQRTNLYTRDAAMVAGRGHFDAHERFKPGFSSQRGEPGLNRRSMDPVAFQVHRHAWHAYF